MDATGANEFLIRGSVRTNDPARPVAEAVLVRGQRIAAVGDFAGLRALAPNARLLDAGGGAVLPGLVDGHAHPAWLGRSLVSVRLEGSASLAEVVSRARAWAAANPHGWVVGRGWDQTLWGDRFPDTTALDAEFPDRPVLLTRVDGHAALANRAALRAAGIGDDVADPKGGRFLRRDDGALSGVLVDTAMDPVVVAIPAPTRTERERWLRAAADHCLALGITGVHDAGVDPDIDEAYVALAAAGALPLRTYAMVDMLDPRGPAMVAGGVRPERHLYAMRAVKLFADGALGSRGAQLFEPYCDDPGNVGLEVQSSEVLRALAEPAARRGFQICVHAIGDRANARVLELFEGLRGAGIALERPRVEHAQLLRPADLPRLAALGAVAAMQPIHATSDMRYAERRLGGSRLDGAYAWKSLMNLGVTVAFGSDFPVEPADPRDGLHAATTRTDRAGSPVGGWHPRESVTADEALDAFTRANAIASFREHELGRISEGFLADLTILAGDPFGPDGRWLDVPVRMTIVDGVVRWEA